MREAVESLLVWEFLVLVVPCLVVIAGTLWVEHIGNKRRRKRNRSGSWHVSPAILALQREVEVISDPLPYDYETDGL